MTVMPLFDDALNLLKKLISIPSISKTEQETAKVILKFFTEKNIPAKQIENNIWATNKYFDASKPTILLNSHHDTVKPNEAYTKNPYEAIVENEKLFGVGSNDAGGALVSLMIVFVHFYNAQNLKYNIVFAATAEEEISGTNGIALLLPHLPIINFGIVGEPTLMQMAIAEKGLIVLDATTNGVAGHAARNEGENAIYKALKDIAWFENFEFEKKSEMLGAIKMSVTQIEAGTQHNVIPAQCHYVVDVRTTDAYTNEEVLAIIKQNTNSNITARSLRLNASGILKTHPIVASGLALGLPCYGSPTLSDQALMPFPTLKIGPGDSARSHTADEYIYLHEIETGIKTYINLLKNIL
jgi:acetylornithine deacetylase